VGVKPTVSILGCGWLGWPLARALCLLGYPVKGSTTSAHKISFLKADGIDPFLIEIDPPVIQEPPGLAPPLAGLAPISPIDLFFQSDILVITLPFRRDFNPAQLYQKEIQSVRDHLRKSKIGFVIFTSSTAMYPKLDRIWTEEDSFTAADERAEVLLSVEQMLFKESRWDTTVVRLAGLYGEDRRPGQSSLGQAFLKDGRQPMNLIHRDDAVEIIIQIIVQDLRGEIFNACADAHPTQKELYTFVASQLGLAPPQFGEGPSSYKIISNQKVKAKLGFSFKHHVLGSRVP